jgi:hypothetical protein
MAKGAGRGAEALTWNKGTGIVFIGVLTGRSQNAARKGTNVPKLQ